MTNSELTQENFSFFKTTLLQPPFEVVRYAFGNKTTGISPGRPPKKGKEDRPEVYIDRDGDSSMNSSDVSFNTPEVVPKKRGHPSLKNSAGQKRKRESSPDVVEVIKQESDDISMTILSSPDTEKEEKKETTPGVSSNSVKKYKPTARKSTTQKPSKPANASSAQTRWVMVRL